MKADIIRQENRQENRPAEEPEGRSRKALFLEALIRMRAFGAAVSEWRKFWTESDTARRGSL